MKSSFKQFSGTYRKENDYVIPNLNMPDTGNFKIGIYGHRHKAKAAVSSENVEKFIRVYDIGTNFTTPMKIAYNL